MHYDRRSWDCANYLDDLLDHWSDCPSFQPFPTSHLRKLRLFAAACFYRIPDHDYNLLVRQTVLLLRELDQVTFSIATLNQVRNEWRELDGPVSRLMGLLLSQVPEYSPLDSLRILSPRRSPFWLSPPALDPQTAIREEEDSQLQHLRELFAPPFRREYSSSVSFQIRIPIRFDPHMRGEPSRSPHTFGAFYTTPPQLQREWMSSTVVGLMQTILRDEAWELLPKLSDALQDQGCDDPEVHHHLQNEHLPHHLNCWVLDWLRGY